MAKKDTGPRLDEDRSEERGKDCAENRTDRSGKDKKQPARTEVKNAHATGLGAIGRNDQRIEKENSDFSNY